MRIYEKCLKRLFDILLSVILIVFLSPVYFLSALFTLIYIGRPVLFKQSRPGKDSVPFIMYKFRTMSNELDEYGKILPDSDRLNKFGRIMRSLSLDELPELINILKGDMSFIGPRPLAMEYLPFYTNEEKKRHNVRPGLTGLAQINGRNIISWESRFSYDIEYVNRITFLNDLRILLKTISVVLKRDGIGERGIDAPQDFHKYREKKESGSYDTER